MTTKLYLHIIEETCIAQNHTFISKFLQVLPRYLTKTWKSGVFTPVYPMWSVLPGFVASEFIVFCCFDVDQVVMDLVHHHQAAVESTILERWPVESAHHICHATGAVVISNNESSSTALDLFNLLDISVSVGIPSWGSEFNSWPDVSVVGCFLHLLAAVAEIPREEGFGTMDFPGDGINMGCPDERQGIYPTLPLPRLGHG